MGVDIVIRSESLHDQYGALVFLELRTGECRQYSENAGFRSHVVMIVLNDTITHQYSAHTNDRKQYVFYDNSSYEYYMVQN